MVTTEDDLAERTARTPSAESDDAMQGLTSTAPVPLRHPGRWVACTAVVLMLAWFAYLVSTNPNFQWPVVGKYLFNPEILQGVLLTIQIGRAHV